MKKQGEFLIKDIDLAKREVKFAFVKFNDYDADGDLTLPFSFKKTIQEMGPKGTDRVAHLWNHERKTIPPIGRVIELWEDQDGAYAHSKMLNSQLANDVLDAYDQGAIKEHSYWGKGIDVTKNENGGLLIKQVKLMEVSSVIWGAQERARLMKSMENGIEDFEALRMQLNDLSAWVKKSKASDEFLKEIEFELEKTLDLIPTLEKSGREESPEIKEPSMSLADIYNLKL
jgi:HK97 family phage prohead protease